MQSDDTPNSLGQAAMAFALQSLGITSIPALAEAVRDAIAPVGMTAAASGFVSGPRAASLTPFHFVSWPESWMKFYLDNNFLLVDPLPRWARSGGRALSWSELFRILPLRDPGRRVIEAAVQFGFVEGMAIPMRAENNYLGLVAFGGPCPSLSPAAQTFLTIVGRAAFEAAERIERDGDPKLAPIMTEREIECLGLLVQGHSDREIGKILGVSEATARFHLSNAREKSSAQSRTHMAALAVALGYLTF